MKVMPEQLRLYAVTDRAWLNGRRLAEQVEEAIRGGATIVQLREKHLTGEDLIREAEEVLDVCRKAGVPLIINDSVELAIAVDADGVHIGQEDMTPLEARAMLGPDKILGVSAHNPEEAAEAVRQGADYLGCGAAFGSSTKLDAHPITEETMKAVTACVDVPVVAIGGITRENIPELQGRGLAGVALVSAIFAQPDIEAASRKLRELADRL